MKIIGKTGRGFIVECEESEIYNLVGYHYRGSRGAPQLGIGSVVNVSAMFRHLGRLADNQSKLETVRQYLTGVSESLKLVEPVVAAIVDDEEEDGGRG